MNDTYLHSTYNAFLLIFHLVNGCSLNVHIPLLTSHLPAFCCIMYNVFFDFIRSLRNFTFSALSYLYLHVLVVTASLHCFCAIPPHSFCVVTHYIHFLLTPYQAHFLLYISPFTNQQLIRLDGHESSLQALALCNTHLQDAPQHSSSNAFLQHPKRLVSDSLLLTSDLTTSTIFTFSITIFVFTRTYC
jgi:hypothetical protein